MSDFAAKGSLRYEKFFDNIDVNRLSAEGVVEGYPDGNFCGDNKITLGETAGKLALDV